MTSFCLVLERTRQKYRFVVIGYVVMPEHFHLLITGPEVGNPSVVMKVVKERFTKLLHHGGMRTGPIWQKRFYDFNVCSTEKRIEKLRYIHRNPEARFGRKIRRVGNGVASAAMPLAKRAW